MITVLYVDDHDMLLKSIKRQLEGMKLENFRVLATDSLVAASSYLGDADVALLDWDPMGPAMVAACRAAGVPFVIFTGDPHDVHVASITMAKVISKPASSKEIAEGLKLALAGER